jgi:hypothetical protein
MRRRLGLVSLLLLVTPFVVPSPPADAEPQPTLAWPDRRFATCGAVDPDGDVLYAFGGRADDGRTHLGDLWALDLGHGGRDRPAWRAAATAGAPSAPPPVRSCAAAWDDADHRLVVFGGWDGVTHDGAVRSFDPVTGAWSMLCDAMSCGPGPAARRASQVVVDEDRHRLVVFGGTNGTYFDDLWTLDLSSLAWRRVATPGPISRGGHSMALAPGGDSVWLFGGTRPGADLGDLWRLDLATDTWTDVEPVCDPACPSARSGASLVADPVGARLVLYGGWESATDTYHGEAWALQDLDGSPVWSPITPSSESPQARFFQIAGYDPAGQRVVVFGGGANGSAYKDALGLVLPVDGRPAAWHSLAPVTGLTARDQVTVVLDRGVLTAFGGFGSGSFPGTVDAGTHLADSWQRAIDRRDRWRLVTPLDPAQVPLAREGTAYALDERNHRLLLFGGLDGDTTLADVWVADLSRPGRPRWRQLCSAASCGAGPSARWGGHAVYDPAGDRFVVFGGLTASGATANDVWALKLGDDPTWHELAPDGPAPAARWSAAYGFDPVRRRLVVFGGQTGPDGSGAALDDAWALSLDGPPRWTQLALTGERPAPRRSPAGAIRRRGRHASLVVAMGLTTSTGEHHGDVWSLDLGDDSATWIELTPDMLGTGPSPRRSAAGVYDLVGDRVLVLFGRDGSAFTDETWSFDLRHGSWTEH